MKAISGQQSWLPYLLLLISIVLWGATGVVVKEVLQQLPMFTALFGRTLVAAIVLLPFVLVRRRQFRIPWRDASRLLAVGSLGMTMTLGCFFVGVRSASILDMSVIIALSPFMLAVGSWYFLHDRLDRRQWLGFGLATAGVLLALTHGAAVTKHSLSGDLWIGMSCLATVGFTILSKQLSRQYSPLVLVTMLVAAALPVFGLLSIGEIWLRPVALPSLGLDLVSRLVFLGIGASVLAYLGYEWVLSRLSASTVAALSYIQPLVSIVLAVWLLGERLSLGYIIGGLVTMVGIYLALRAPHLRRTPARHHLPSRQPVIRS